jgi:hypothetical protein
VAAQQTASAVRGVNLLLDAGHGRGCRAASVEAGDRRM